MRFYRRISSRPCAPGFWRFYFRSPFPEWMSDIGFAKP